MMLALLWLCLYYSRTALALPPSSNSGSEGGYPHPVTRAIIIPYTQLAKLNFDQSAFWSISQLKCIFSVILD